MTNMELVGLLATSPRTAFAELEKQPVFWFPLLLTALGTAGMLFWFYSIVDLPWLMETTLRATPQGANLSDEQVEQMATATSRNLVLWSSTIGGLFGLVVIRLLEATYYTIAGNVTNVQRTFKQWFALSCWTGLPHLISIIPAIVLLLLTDTTQIRAEALQPLSLNELFFHREMGQPGYSLLSNLSILHPVVWALSAIGVQVWSGRSWLFSAVFALLPAAIFFGGWAIIAF